MLTRSREAALPTISHCVSGELRRHVSPTVKPGKLFSLEKQEKGEVQNRERKKRHRSNGHQEVYCISIQLESEKLSQSQLGIFGRKKLTRGKNHINITVLNQYMKPSNVLLQGCSIKLGPAVVLIQSDYVCKQHRSGHLNSGWQPVPCLRDSLGLHKAEQAAVQLPFFTKSGTGTVEASLSGEMTPSSGRQTTENHHVSSLQINPQRWVYRGPAYSCEWILKS